MTTLDAFLGEPVLGPALEALLEERRIQAGRRLWAAVMLARIGGDARPLDVCRSILLGQPVRVDALDPVALRRALRGAVPIKGTMYIEVTAEMLDAVDEPGGFVVVQEQPR